MCAHPNALGRRSSIEETLDADIFIEIGPMNALTLSDRTPVAALPCGSMEEARVPLQRHHDRTAVTELDDKRIVDDAYARDNRVGSLSL